jgi:glycosyltransferase involved in cell wall biosynthesis
LLLHVLLQLDLARAAFRGDGRASDRRAAAMDDVSLPTVTVQLPVYNERHVIERLIDACARLRYPAGRLEIQVLDDSTDDTTARVAARLQVPPDDGRPIRHLRRGTRPGYKAGALAAGLEQATGEVIAIFDADFMPAPDFLLRAVPYLDDPTVAVAQGRWEYVNRRQSMLTRIQAMMLDNHFAIEQRGRAAGGRFVTFNGSAGLWRASAIRDAGGWRAETLTEDLDLSYRVQLRGWRAVYVDGLRCDSELPSDLASYRAQQRRWMRGVAQNARQLLPSVARANLTVAVKVHAAAHLLESSVYLAVLGLVGSTAGLTLVRAWHEAGPWPFLHPAILIAALGLFVVFLRSQRSEVRTRSDLLVFSAVWIAFFVLTTGLAVQNGLAAAQGWARQGGEFVRTPKGTRAGGVSATSYSAIVPRWIILAESLAWIGLAGALAVAAVDGQLLLAWLPLVALVGLSWAIVGSWARRGRQILTRVPLHPAGAAPGERRA